jgi:hypothetical protein
MHSYAHDIDIDHMHIYICMRICMLRMMIIAI